MDRDSGITAFTSFTSRRAVTRPAFPQKLLDLHVALLQLPLVVLLEQHRADQPDDGRLKAMAELAAAADPRQIPYAA